MFRKLSRVSVTVSQVYCKISVLSIFVSVCVMSKSIVYSLVIAGNSAPICLLCISDDLLSILAILTSRNVWHFLPHMWSNSFNCWILPLLLNKFGLLYMKISLNHRWVIPPPQMAQFTHWREITQVQPVQSCFIFYTSKDTHEYPRGIQWVIP